MKPKFKPLTRNGYKYRILAYDLNGPYPIVYAVDVVGREVLNTADTSGSIYGSATRLSPYDLIPEDPVYEYPVIYKSSDSSYLITSQLYKDEEEFVKCNPTHEFVCLIETLKRVRKEEV
jgi:hypothetical protein